MQPDDQEPHACVPVSLLEEARDQLEGFETLCREAGFRNEARHVHETHNRLDAYIQQAKGGHDAE